MVNQVIDKKIQWFDSIIESLGCRCCASGKTDLLKSILLSDFNNRFNMSFDSLLEAYEHTFIDGHSSAYDSIYGQDILNMDNDW